jgi:hypothetical protein
MTGACWTSSFEKYIAAAGVPADLGALQRADGLAHRLWQDARLPDANRARAEAAGGRGGLCRAATAAARARARADARADRADWQRCQAALALCESPLGAAQQQHSVRCSHAAAGARQSRNADAAHLAARAGRLAHAFVFATALHLRTRARVSLLNEDSACVAHYALVMACRHGHNKTCK